MPKSPSRPTRPKIGLALGSGSARGWSHIGILEGLLDAGIKPDIICGCSIGAFVGAAYIADKLDVMKEWALSLTMTKIVSLMDVGLVSGGLINGKLIVDLLQKIGIDQPIQSYSTPFAAIATDFMTGREMWLQEGPIHEAIRASISIPGIFSPVQVGEKWLLDGGLVNPVPISTCRALGADIVIAVNLHGDIIGRSGVASEVARTSGKPRSPRIFENPLLDSLAGQIPREIRKHASYIVPKLFQTDPSTPGYFDVLANSINIMQDRITRSRLAGDPPHVMLIPRLIDFGLLEFNRAEEAIQEGRACVEQSLPLLKRFL